MARAPSFPAFFAVTAVACGAPPQPGTPVTFDDFCDPKYDLPSDALADAPLPRMTIDGYLVPPSMFSLCSDTCSFDLAEQPDGSGRSIRYSVRVGSSNNQLARLPERFESSDFKLKTNSGDILGFGDKVRLTGQRLGNSAENSCQLYKVDLVEKPSP